METVWIVLTQLVLLHTVSASIKNVAKDKPASMSSSKDTRINGYKASTAVDGNINAGGYSGNLIIDTGTGHPFAWWKVDLEKEVQDATVRIYFRTPYKNRRNGVQLHTSTSPFNTSNPTSQGQLCHTVTGDPSGNDIPDVYSVTCPGRWRYLLLYTDTDNDGKGPVLDFGEVEVFVLKACSQENYGEDCAKSCSSRNCVTMSTTCETDGRCLGGCTSGWTGADCLQACDSGTYGPGCSLSCSARNCLDASSPCDHVAGQCVGGCKAGSKGTDCTKACDSGTYGPGCSLSCSARNCLDASSPCDHVAGQCVGGCKAGSKGTDCTKACDSGTYGPGCSLSCSARNCLDASSPCDHVTGQCVGGCKAGSKDTDCTKACDSDSYGAGCSLSCSARNCLDASSPCDHVTGQCVGGCNSGYYYTDCTQKCPDGFYGPGCNKTCGKCSSGPVCDKVNGNCVGGCKSGWRTSLCDEATSTGESGYIIIPAAAGAAAALVVIVIVIVVVIVIYRRKRSQRPKINATQQKINTSRHIVSNKSSKRKEDIALDKVYVNVAMEPGDIINAEIPPELIKKTKPSSATKTSTDSDGDELEEILDEDEAPTSTPYYNIDEEDVIREVAVEDLAATVQKIKRREGGFEAEYRRLPTGFTATYADSQKEENEGKNKFRGYYPYDHNRVRLSLFPDVPGSDYINASIMHNINETKTYIGAQAPKKKTLGDFWRMIWEKRCARVVMLTGLVEETREKCYQYWPEDDQLTTDIFRVTLEDTNTRANYTIRSMKVEKIQTGESRRVVQYHYTTWPDHGVPGTLALVNFIWMMRRTHTRTDGPLLVHCSAGIGRTGTYIAVDSLLDQAREEGKVDVQGYVSMMRGQRKNMIQTTDQYECVFNCLVEMTKYGNTSLTVDDFTTLYTNSGMDARVDSVGKTFRELAEMMLAEDNQDAPVKKRMWVDGNEEFIVRTAPSLRSMRGHLLCVSPHPGQEKLLWKLVEENNVNNVIVLDSTQNDLVGGKETTKLFNEIKLTTEEQTKLTSDLSLSKLLLQIPIHQSEQKLQLLKFQEPMSIESLSITFMEHSHLKLMTSELTSRVVVHGSTERKVGMMFCMLGNLMSEIQEDETVDVLHQVRSFTRIFPDITLTQDDVKQLFNFARRCAQLTASTYANM